MSSYCYEAVDAGGLKMRGTLEVTDQGEALRRLKDMGLFPTKLTAAERQRRRWIQNRETGAGRTRGQWWSLFRRGRVRSRALVVLTRQLATLIEAGMPLLRGLRTLQEQAESAALRQLLADVGASIESGNSFSESLAAHPRVFNPLYVNMVRAGELGGVLDIALRRLAEFMEKSQKIKGRIKAAMFYPTTVFIVAVTIMAVLMVFVVPKFQEVFDGVLSGGSMPAFTVFVLGLSMAVKKHIVAVLAAACAGGGLIGFGSRTAVGRRVLDQVKLTMPLLGPVFRKAAISRFARTLGTLLNSGVPILQALTIVRETAGNVIVGSVVSNVHESVKQGDTIAIPLKASRVFPAMVAGMVDIGEQTGALPDMLGKIADTYDEEVDMAVTAMTSLLEPIMIVFLAVVVGGIVIAMFLPLFQLIDEGVNPNAAYGDN